MDKNSCIWLKINFDDKEKWAISIKTSWIRKNRHQLISKVFKLADYTLIYLLHHNRISVNAHMTLFEYSFYEVTKNVLNILSSYSFGIGIIYVIYINIYMPTRTIKLCISYSLGFISYYIDFYML